MSRQIRDKAKDLLQEKIEQDNETVEKNRKHLERGNDEPRKSSSRQGLVNLSTKYHRELVQALRVCFKFSFENNFSYFNRPLPKPLAKPGQKTFRPARQNNFSMFKYAHTALSEPHLLHPNIYALLIFCFLFR